MSVVIRRIISHLCELTEIFTAFFERYMNTVYNPFPMKCDNFYFSTPPDALFSENRLPPTLPLHLSRKSHAYWVFFLRFVMIWLLRLQGWLFVRLFQLSVTQSKSYILQIIYTYKRRDLNPSPIRWNRLPP